MPIPGDLIEIGLESPMEWGTFLATNQRIWGDPAGAETAATTGPASRRWSGRGGVRACF